MRNGGRDARHGMKRLEQVGLRETFQKNRFQRRGHADRVAGRAVATLVGRTLVAWVTLVMLMGDLVAHFMLMRVLQSDLSMTRVVMLKPCLELYGRRRAKGHSYRSVALEGYGEHHEPKQDRAQTNHMEKAKPCFAKRRRSEFEPSHRGKVKSMRTFYGLVTAFVNEPTNDAR